MIIDFKNRMSPDEVVTLQEKKQARSDNMQSMIDAAQKLIDAIDNVEEDGYDYSVWMTFVQGLQETWQEEKETIDEELNDLNKQVQELEHGNWEADV